MYVGNNDKTEYDNKNKNENKDENDNEKKIIEGGIEFIVEKGVFYNPHTELSRDLSSLVISTLQKNLSVCDGMCGTGIRGIRYALENKNVENITFVDLDEKACKNTKTNLEKLKNSNILTVPYEVFTSDINHFLYVGGKKFNFIEIDPFGSPVPFVRSALFNLRRSKRGYLSITATDTAVLCGAQQKACQIYYGAKPLDNYFCHETGVRILLGHIARISAPLDLGIKPLFSFSKRHYFKIILEIEKSAQSAFNSTKQLGYVSWCPNCFDTKIYTKPFINEKCECKSNVEWAGPLWLGKMFDKDTIEKTTAENKQRDYKNKKEISSILYLMTHEAEMPPFYFDLHKIFDKLDVTPKKFDDIIAKLNERGYRVTRTHFNPHAIKTEAPAKEILNIIKS